MSGAGVVYFATKVLEPDARDSLIVRTANFLEDGEGQLIRGLVKFLWQFTTMSIPARLATDVLKLLLRHHDCWQGPATRLVNITKHEVCSSISSSQMSSLELLSSVHAFLDMQATGKHWSCPDDHSNQVENVLFRK